MVTSAMKKVSLKAAASKVKPAAKKLLPAASPAVGKVSVATKPKAPAPVRRSVARPKVGTVKKTAAVGVKKAPIAAPVIKEKVKKAKLIRDSFTMPEGEYAALGEVKKACLHAGIDVKKSQLLRIGVALVRAMDLPALRKAVGALSPLKPGRPPKEK